MFVLNFSTNFNCDGRIWTWASGPILQSWLQFRSHVSSGSVTCKTSTRYYWMEAWQLKTTKIKLNIGTKVFNLIFFCNIFYSLLSSWLAPTVKSPIQSSMLLWVELADNSITHNSVTVFFFVLHRMYFFHICRYRESKPWQGALQHSKLSGALHNCTTRAELYVILTYLKKGENSRK